MFLPGRRERVQHSLGHQGFSLMIHRYFPKNALFPMIVCECSAMAESGTKSFRFTLICDETLVAFG
jgi:hypothetical protein